MIHYILQTIAFQLLFLMVYDFFLKKETFFGYNRLYLLVTPMVSLLLPFVQISAIRKSIPTAYVVELPPVLVGSVAQIPTVTQTSVFSWTHLWVIGVVVSVFILGYKLIKILKLKRSSTKISHKDFHIRILPKTTTAFTFFQTIFLGDQLSDLQKENVLLHEQAHVKEHHSLDLFYFELMRVLFWFNPLLYIYQNRIASLHEFIADRFVAQNKTPQVYYQNLLSEVFQTEKISFINTFFNHSLIKNRIVMLQKSKSKQIFKLKYLLLVPIVGTMLLYSSCAQDANAQKGENTFTSASENESEILTKIADLKESIAKKGEMTKEEEDALKVLYVLTNANGLETEAFQDVKDKVKIPFGVIEKIPVFPGCEGLDNEASKKCFSQKTSSIIAAAFNTKVAPPEVKGKQRIVVEFNISNKGVVEDVVARAEHKELKEEAERVVKMLPKMIPGEHQGKKVGVHYSLPILFDIK